MYKARIHPVCGRLYNLISIVCCAEFVTPSYAVVIVKPLHILRVSHFSACLPVNLNLIVPHGYTVGEFLFQILLDSFDPLILWHSGKNVFFHLDKRTVVFIHPDAVLHILPAAPLLCLVQRRCQLFLCM